MASRTYTAHQPALTTRDNPQEIDEALRASHDGLISSLHACHGDRRPSLLCGPSGGPPGLPDEWEGDEVPCCLGSALDGPRGCTCWEPVYDLGQCSPAGGQPGTRDRLCHDCAYRPGSPERARGDELPAGPTPFWCHQGMRRVIAWRHPDGRQLPPEPGDYRPPIIDGQPYRADGTPAQRCAGWAATAHALSSSGS